MEARASGGLVNPSDWGESVIRHKARAADVFLLLMQFDGLMATWRTVVCNDVLRNYTTAVPSGKMFKNYAMCDGNVCR
jgi:hypothetical protein